MKRFKSLFTLFCCACCFLFFSGATAPGHSNIKTPAVKIIQKAGASAAAFATISDVNLYHDDALNEMWVSFKYSGTANCYVQCYFYGDGLVDGYSIDYAYPSASGIWVHLKCSSALYQSGTVNVEVSGDCGGYGEDSISFYWEGE